MAGRPADRCALAVKEKALFATRQRLFRAPHVVGPGLSELPSGEGSSFANDVDLDLPIAL